MLDAIVVTASGDEVTSVETFNQTTNTLTGTVATATGTPLPSTFEITPGAGVYGQDIGLYGELEADPNSPTDGQTTFHTLNPLAGGTPPGPWTPPLQQPFESYLGAMNQETNTVAFLTQGQTASGDVAWQVFASNLATNTAGPAYNLNAAVAGAGYQNPSFNAIGQNSATNTAVLAGFDDPEGPARSTPTLVTVGLERGQIATFDGVGDGRPAGLVVNPRMNTAYVPMDSRLCRDGHVSDPALGICDLTTKTGRLVPNLDVGTLGMSIDEAHGFIFELTISDTPFSQDNNLLNPLLVLKEDGTVVQRIARFNFWNELVPVYAHLLQINPTSRTGYTYGPFGQQLEPFSY